MKTHSKPLIGAVLALFFALAMSSSHAAEENGWRYSTKVKVNISAPDHTMGSVRSYVNRELRSLSDVEIVENEPEWIIHILVMELKTVGGYKSGVAISTSIVRTFSSQLLSGMFQPKFKDIGLQMTSGVGWHADLWLNVGAVDDVQKLCKDIIADFDTKHLEESRKWLRQMKEMRPKEK